MCSFYQDSYKLREKQPSYISSLVLKQLYYNSVTSSTKSTVALLKINALEGAAAETGGVLASIGFTEKLSIDFVPTEISLFFFGFTLPLRSFEFMMIFCSLEQQSSMLLDFTNHAFSLWSLLPRKQNTK